MQVMARLATEEDLPAVVHLLVDSSAVVGSERGGSLFLHREGVPEPFEQQLRRYLADAGACLAVGTAEGVILGVAIGRLEPLHGGGCLARLELLWVDAGARQVGLGAELMDLVIAWAQANGAASLDAYALPGNREAKNFLETAGFSARLIVMNRELSGPAS